MSLPHAVIIAGGEGQRLGGVRKADLRIGGMRQLDRVIRALGAVAAPVLVSVGPMGRSIGLAPDCVAVPDIVAECAGPVAGLVAAVDWLAGQEIVDGLLVSAAVDTPFLPRDFVARMGAALGAAPAAFAAWGDDFYPPNAIWRIEAITALPDRVRSGAAPASLKALLRELGARRVDWQTERSDNPFRNINTVADLVDLQRIAVRA
ncbi:molybdenum cofactor guanylyltransferase [Devosia sp. SL43]|uniref:molybdenum cofactor guanylyltransferase n=1 Tax=Devosia sp. SL43 TaxID=2806348 RepID=UPI001F470D1D|nr:molybdenum cofactor guanylyltransferase [Devosia sp. SL43]UJW85947.1 molybdenum cofactor guanylyltransferase [Devosia sp. SL43]